MKPLRNTSRLVLLQSMITLLGLIWNTLHWSDMTAFFCDFRSVQAMKGRFVKASFQWQPTGIDRLLSFVPFRVFQRSRKAWLKGEVQVTTSTASFCTFHSFVKETQMRHGYNLLLRLETQDSVVSLNSTQRKQIFTLVV